jgi:hypothetical protein
MTHLHRRRVIFLLLLQRRPAHTTSVLNPVPQLLSGGGFLWMLAKVGQTTGAMKRATATSFLRFPRGSASPRIFNDRPTPLPRAPLVDGGMPRSIDHTAPLHLGSPWGGEAFDVVDHRVQRALRSGATDCWLCAKTHTATHIQRISPGSRTDEQP